MLRFKFFKFFLLVVLGSRNFHRPDNLAQTAAFHGSLFCLFLWTQSVFRREQPQTLWGALKDLLPLRGKAVCSPEYIFSFSPCFSWTTGERNTESRHCSSLGCPVLFITVMFPSLPALCFSCPLVVVRA